MRLPILIIQRAKLLNSDWSTKRVFFFLIVLREKGKITRSRLVLRLPSNSLCSREVVFSGTMASRFKIVDEEYIENEKTKDSTEW